MKSRPLVLGTLVLAIIGAAIPAGIELMKLEAPSLADAPIQAPLKPQRTAVPRVAAEAKSPVQAAAAPAATPAPSLKGPALPLPEPAQPAKGLLGAVYSSNNISEKELQRRAAIVEQAANHDLKQLVGLLDLTGSQQDRIFNKLAQRTPEWHPSMQATPIAIDATSGKNSPAAQAPSESKAKQDPPSSTPAEMAKAPPDQPLLDAIAEDLTPNQQQELADTELDRQEWWEEIIPQLLPEDTLPGSTSSGGIGSSGSSGAAAGFPLPPDNGPSDTKSGGDALTFD
jgi:hypothetical protein